MKKILLICLILLTSCNTPNLTICVSDPANNGFQCSKGGGSKFFLDYKKSENYIALPYDDARTVIEKCYQDNKDN